MGILSSSIISSYNLNAKFRYEEQLSEIENKLIALQEYAATISDTSVSLEAMSNVPASMFGRLTKFMTNADSVATQKAQQKYWFMQQTPGAISDCNGDVQAQQLYNWQLQNSLFETERKAMVDAETKKLHAEETKLTAKKTQIEKHIKLIEDQMTNENNNYKSSVQLFYNKG